MMTAVTVSAVTGTDYINDVYDGELKKSVSKPNIDITTIRYELSGNTAILAMTVKGSIIDSEYIEYSITLSNNIDPSSGYMMYYTNGTGGVLKDGMSTVDSGFWVSQENTIAVTFNLSENEIRDFNLFMGFNIEYSEDTGDIRWIDSAPNDFNTTWYGVDEDDDTVGDDNGDHGGGTPGFELILVVCAIVLLMFWKRKR